MDFSSFKKQFQKVAVNEWCNSVPLHPKVSVLVQTYNHEDYIRECLDSILSQKVDFEYEILLGEDESNDSTREICIEYANRFPGIIRLFLHSRKNNIKLMGKPTGRFNLCYNLYSARGEYIALCEGDDFWTEELKLQKQVSFLEANKDFTMCFHKVSIVAASEDDRFEYKIPPFDILRFNDLLRKHYIPTCSLMIRLNVFGNELPSILFKTLMADIPLELISATKGKTKFLVENMACYRRNAGGVTQDKDRTKHIRSINIQLYKELIKTLDISYSPVLLLKIFRYRIGGIKQYLYSFNR